MKSKQVRGKNWLLSGGTALGLIVIAEPGCMPDFNALSSKWKPAAGAAGKHDSGGAGGLGGTSETGGTGATPTGGRNQGGKGGKGGKGGTGATGGTGNTGVGGTGGTGVLGGEGGEENGGNAGVTEPTTGGTSTAGGTGGTSTTGGAGGTSTTGGSAGTGTAASGGSGGMLCDPGYTTCPGSDACSTRLSLGNPSGATVTDCGACGVTCSLTNASAATCSAGNCRATCTGTFADCNQGTTNDGCESDLTSPAACGSCTHPCSTDGATTRACTSGACVPACSPKYLDCNADTGAGADDGCETYLDGLTTCGTTCSDGVTCNSDQVCNGGACVAPDGLVVMSIPFSDQNGSGQRYADKFGGNLAGSKLVLRLYAPGATNGNVIVYLEDTSFRNGPSTQVDFSTLSAGWTDVVVDCGQKTGSFDPTMAYQVSLDFYATNSEPAPWSNPVVVYLDSVRSKNLLINDTFTSSTGAMVTSSLLKVTNSSFNWTAAMPPP